MAATDTYVRARIDAETKDRAEAALQAMGLDVSTAIRMLLTRIGAEGKMPFAIKTPNATTKRAMAELDAGKGKRVAGIDELMADLHAGD